MDIGIIGYGVVGKAINNTFSKKYNVIKYDKFINYNNFIDLKNCDFVFISVPSPFNKKLNKIDLSAIEESLNSLLKHDFKGTVIIKSTIPPGSTDTFLEKYSYDICFNPEFLRESVSPNEDFANQNLVVIGARSSKIFDRVKVLYQEVLMNEAKYVFVDPKVAEMVKYAQNMTLASRVAIANIVFDACQKFDIEYSKVKKLGFESFDILGPYMVEVPGPDGQRGFGGKCLPKDTDGFNSIFKSDVLSKIIEYNHTLRDDLD